MKPSEANAALYLRLAGLIDAAMPECYWKRGWLRTWHETGSLEKAYDWWLQSGPRNRELLPKIRETMQEIKEVYSGFKKGPR